MSARKAVRSLSAKISLGLLLVLLCGPFLAAPAMAYTAPSVTTNAPANIGATSATLKGNLTSKGGYAAGEVDVWFQWRVVGSTVWNATTVSRGVSTGIYSFTVSGLNGNTSYEFRAVAYGVYGLDYSTSYGGTNVFKTADTRPVASEGGQALVVMDEDSSPTPFSLTLNATDADGDTLTWSIATAASHGTAIASGTGASKGIGYAPNPNYNGSDSFTVRVSDGFGGADDITVNVTISPRNDAPINTVSPVITGSPHPGKMLSTTTGTWDDSRDSLAGTMLTYKYYWQRSADGVNWANITNANNASYTVGSADLNYQIRCAVDCLDHCDGNPPDMAAEAWSNVLVVTNAAPIISEGMSVAQTMDEDSSPTPFSLTLNATDADGDTLTWSIATAASHGTAIASGTGASKGIGYAPNPNYNGSDSFTVRVSDGFGGADDITVNVTVTPVNDVPSFTKGADQTVLEDCGAQTVNSWATAISAGPANESGQALDFIVSNNNNALFSVQPAVSSTGILTYTPAANMNGSATVTVQIHDDGGTANGGVDTSAAQTFTITVTPVNDVPSFTKGADQTVLEDCGAQTVNSWATAISAGPANESGQALDFIVSNNSALFSVQPAVSSTGVLTYTPAANANGSATVTVQIHDDGGTANGGVDTSAAQTFTITVTPVNDPPVNTVLPVISGIPHVGRILTATDGSWNDSIDTSVSGTSALSYTYQWQRSTDGGTNYVNISGAVGSTYVVTLADNLQKVRVQVTCSDTGVGQPDSQSTRISSDPISVINAAPVIIEGVQASAACDEDESPVAFTYTLHAIDADAIDTLTWHILAPPAHGTLTLPAASVGLTTASSFYHPAANWNGVDSFTLQVEDGLSGTATIIVTVTVNPRNDAPVNVVLPSARGHFWVGSELTGDAGQWSDAIDMHPGNLTLSYQWERARDATGTGGEAISGATGITYRVQGRDEGWFLRLVVTCTDDGETPPASMSTAVATQWTKAVYNDREPPTITIANMSGLPGVSGYVAKPGTGSNNENAEYWLTVRQAQLALSFLVQDDRPDGILWTVSRGTRVLTSGTGLGTWNPNILLQEGLNDLAVGARDAAGNTTTQFLHVICDTQAPVIEFPRPLPGSVASSAFSLAGMVRDVTTGVRSLAIGGQDVIPFGDGSFNTTILLKRGTNTIVVEAVDGAGNKRSESVNVVYNPVVPSASSGHTIEFKIGSKFMSLDGRSMVLDAPAQILEGRTLVPLRVLVEQLGGTILWNAKTRQVTLKARGTTIVLTIGKNTALVNGKGQAIDPANSKVVPVLVSGRTMLPLRFVAENLGLEVAWNGTTRVVSLSWSD